MLEIRGLYSCNRTVVMPSTGPAEDGQNKQRWGTGETQMGQQGAVLANMHRLRSGTWKCLAFSLPMPNLWRGWATTFTSIFHTLFHISPYINYIFCDRFQVCYPLSHPVMRCFNVGHSLTSTRANIIYFCFSIITHNKRTRQVTGTACGKWGGLSMFVCSLGALQVFPIQ